MMETQFSQALEKIIQEFQTRNDIDIHEIDTRSREGQRLRGELPVKLKEGAGLNYKEIAGIEIFKNLKFSTLRSMYRNMKQRNKKVKVKISKKPKTCTFAPTVPLFRYSRLFPGNI
jgi:hypothetical protein